MLSKIITASVNGMDVEKVIVETDFSQGLPNLSLVGLPDATVRESRERIRSAIINSGYVFPLKRITVNLSPADTRKTGSHFDLPMAVGILKSMGMIGEERIADSAFLGELSLDGTVNPVASCLALVMGLKEYGIRNIFLPRGNTRDLIKIDGIKIFGINNFTELVDHLSEMATLEPESISTFIQDTDSKDENKDYSDIYGQESGKRAMQVCAAGWHDIMMVGPPGAGKTMLAARLGTILPDPTEEELMEITRIHSIAGERLSEMNAAGKRPFRSPHHTATSVSLMGGGYNSKPGELSLAHRGVLFLDELPEFQRKVLDMLRQPLEDGYINLTRLAARHRYPCRFILVTAMNPCPCGYYGDYAHECVCNTMQRARYAQKVSGPLKDRMDIHIRINAVDYKEVSKKKKAETTSKELKAGVMQAAKIQKRRYEGKDYSFNSQIPDNMLSEYCIMNDTAKDMLKAVSINMDLSARAVSKIKRVSRTIADLDCSEIISDMHIAEAISYRTPQGNDLLN